MNKKEAFLMGFLTAQIVGNVKKAKEDSALKKREEQRKRLTEVIERQEAARRNSLNVGRKK